MNSQAFEAARERPRPGMVPAPLRRGVSLALALLALPVYFIRSRGWKRGLVATFYAAGILALTLGLNELGERIGAAL